MKFIVVSRRSVWKFCALCLALTLLCFVTYASGAASVYLLRTDRKLPVYRVATEHKTIALSFDATYGAEKTTGIMELLQKYDFEATFFLVGFWMDNNPELTKAIAENGFEIGTHSNVHAHMSRLSYNQCVEDLQQSIDKIKKYTGSDTKVFRAPFGEYNNTLINAAESLKLMTVQWDVDSLDWMKKTPEQIINRVLSRTKEGSIILFHNDAEHVLTVLPAILSRLTERGYKGVKMSELVMFENYGINSHGEQYLLQDKGNT